MLYDFKAGLQIHVDTEPDLKTLQFDLSTYNRRVGSNDRIIITFTNTSRYTTHGSTLSLFSTLLKFICFIINNNLQNCWNKFIENIIRNVTIIDYITDCNELNEQTINSKYNNSTISKKEKKIIWLSPQYVCNMFWQSHTKEAFW